MKLNKEPKLRIETKMMCNAIVEIDNPYLQAWADTGAIVMLTGGDFWILTGLGQLLLKIHDESMHLECIAVRSDERRQGKGGTLMKYVVEISDETGIPVTLQVDDVSNGNMMTMPHPVVGVGQDKKNKIPVGSLTKWYEKFGFKKTDSYTTKKRSMIYTPKAK